VQLPRLLSGDVLAPLYRAYHRELVSADADEPVSAIGYDDALRWATAGPMAGRPRLVDLQDVSGGQRYAPHPLLAVLADDPTEAVAWTVGDALWSYADRFFDGDQRRDVGYTALRRDARHAAARLLNHTDTTIIPAACNKLAFLFYQGSEWSDADHWWRRAAATGHTDLAPGAMTCLGFLEAEQGNLDQARHWYQQAITTGHTDFAPRAMFGLGILEDKQGNLDQARHCYQQAITTGHTDFAPRAILTSAPWKDGRETSIRPATGGRRPSPPATPTPRRGRRAPSAS
jgi:TPR repeat protein